MTQREAFSKFKGVQDEWMAATFAIARLLRAIESDAGALLESGYPLRPSHVRECAGALEKTFVLRLFAEFEAVLRDYWAIARHGGRVKARARAEILMVESGHCGTCRWRPFDKLTR